MYYFLFLFLFIVFSLLRAHAHRTSFGEIRQGEILQETTGMTG